MRLWTLTILLSTYMLTGCGPDLCSEQNSKIGHLQRESEMWESIAHDWQKDYYEKSCQCPENY